jgi:spindle assembly abnormal protein 6
MSSTSRRDYLFEGELPVRVAHPARDDRVKDLTVAMWCMTPEHSPNENPIRILHVQITDESDYYFLQTLDVSETEFHVLKREQSLLVDFTTFPSKLIELLQLCVQSTPLVGGGSADDVDARGDRKNSTALSTSDAPAFLATLNVSGSPNVPSEFKILERNQFKHLAHLALAFRNGTDQTIKKYLADKVSGLKEDVCGLREKEELLGEKLEEVDQMGRELADLRNDHERDINDLHMKHVAEIQMERERGNMERLELEDSWQQKMEAVQQEGRETQATLTQAKERVIKQDTQLEQMRSLRRQVAELEGENKELQRLNRNALQTANDLTTAQLRVATCEQQLQDKDALLAQGKRLEQSQEQQIEQLGRVIQDMKEDHRESDMKLKECVNEIGKGNKIIQHLQNELKALRNKLKVKSSVIVAQEEKMEIVSNTASEHRQGETRLEARVAEKDAQLESLKDMLASSKQKMEEYHKNVEDNKRIIQWLQKELNGSKLQAIRADQPLSPSASNLGFRTGLAFSSPRSYLSSSVADGPNPYTASGASARAFMASASSSSSTSMSQTTLSATNPAVEAKSKAQGTGPSAYFDS